MFGSGRHVYRGTGAEDGEDGFHVLAGRGLVERDSKASCAGVAKVHPRRVATLDDSGELALRVHRDRVEEMALRHRESMLLEPLLQQGREPVHAARDAREPLGAEIHRIHRGNDREQHLRRADVRGGLLAGCAARASAAQDGMRARPGRPPSRPPVAPACCASTHRAWPCSRHAARRSPWARRSAANCRPRRPRPIGPAPREA